MVAIRFPWSLASAHFTIGSTTSSGLASYGRPSESHHSWLAPRGDRKTVDRAEAQAAVAGDMSAFALWWRQWARDHQHLHEAD
jgi:hypothetical protein